MTKKIYSDRTDLEKLKSNWKKTLGLFARKEYSLSIVRAAVTVEITLNYVIRQELHFKHGLPLTFVNKHLKLANGIKGKLDRLYIPILEGTNFEKQTKGIAKAIEKLNKQRNDIAHKGEFRKKETAQQHIEIAEKAIVNLVKRYNSTFILNEFEPNKTKSKIVMTSAGLIQIPDYLKEDEE